MKNLFILFSLLISVNVAFAENQGKNYVERIEQSIDPEQLQGYYYATVDGSTSRGEFTSGTTIYIPEGTTILELYITNPVFTSWSWSVTPSSNFQGTFPGQWGGMLMSSSGLDNTTVTITGNIVGVGTRTKVLVIREIY